MAKTATYTPTITVVGDGLSLTEAQQTTNANAAPPGSQALTTGDNTVTVPTGFTVTGCKIIPPPSNSVQLTLKGISMDTGVLLNLTGETCLGLAASQASFHLNAASNVTVGLVWY